MYYYSTGAKRKKRKLMTFYTWIENKENAMSFTSEQEAERFVKDRVFDHDIAVIKV